MPDALLSVENLKKYFPTHKGVVRAVDDIGFTINRGETMGLVGESGCGKSTTGRVVIRLIDATGGTVLFNGADINKLPGRQLKKLRREMQIIFQDPYSSLDPRKSVAQIIAKPFKVHHLGTKKEIEAKVDYLMEKVGLSPRLYNKYPHELDGGRRQRVGIARAIALDPSFIVCDEPVSALDVSIQAQILNLLQELQSTLGLTYLFISHDLSVVKHISNRVAVMYLGKIVETAPSLDLFKNPAHPYTKALLSAIPVPKLHRRNRERIILEGNVPSPIDPPPGCLFQGRCHSVMPKCREISPALKEISPGHQVACNLFD